MSLKDLIKAKHKKKGEPSLIVPITEALGRLKGDDRRDGKFHPSDLSYHFCPRNWVLYNFHPDGMKTRQKEIDPRLQRIFDNGHDVHARVQRYLQLTGNLFGDWVRPVTGDVVRNCFARDLPDGNWVYIEVSVNDEELEITGHTDGLFEIDGKLYIVEIKSINSHGYSYLIDEPKGHHSKQGRIYEHCLVRWLEAKQKEDPSFLPGYEIAGTIFLYECKNDQNFLEFVVPVDEADRDKVLSDLAPLMEEAKAWMLTGVMPECHCSVKRVSRLCATLNEI